MPGTLIRSGNTFRGTLELVDGEVFTSWGDYLYFHAEITDTNDTNGDGLPDIIDVPEVGFVTGLAASLLALMSIYLRSTQSTRS